MSMQPTPVPPVPAETVRVVRAAFPKGSVHTRLRDELDVVYADQAFVGLFAVRGRPAVAPWRLAMVLVMQVMEGLSDRQAAEAVRARLDWKYALSLALDDQGFDFSVLSEFRGRVLAGGMEQQLLEVLLGRARQRGLVKAGGRQRTDSTHVLAQLRVLNRLELVAETVRAALNALAVAAPGWLTGWLPADWYDRYQRRVEASRLPQEAGERAALAAQVGGDGMRLLVAVWEPTAPGWLREVEAVQVLRQVWVQQYQVVDGQVCWRAPDNVPTGTGVASPYEPQARHATKRGMGWTGYKVHLTETCEPTAPHLLTHVATTPAPLADLTQTAAVSQGLAAGGLLPGVHLVDGGYVDVGLLLQSHRDWGVSLHGPVGGDSSWQARAGQGFDLGSFTIDWAAKQVRCPQGMTSRSWIGYQDRRGRQLIRVQFAKPDCLACPVRARCTSCRVEPRSITLQPQPLQQALQHARQQQQTPAWRQQYRLRAGVEGTIAQAVSAFGLRRARYRGLAKVHLQHVLTAVAVNLARLDAWLAGRPLAATRTSRLARLRPATALPAA